ncbi:DUF1611 domain-containing protein [Marinobacterium sedimentorum]|uniref:DUF1611 domain-containing protein n=1 Tax=Marinobacterium sedimentorum TaxID=2927804 RepID=UPI0020C6D384|nr:DUF1611 domain-containing protein [Marinobacterium sedimentorum]MCP8690374.1 DUF1611 domain-containing protein [Marinobacterium sedimentorum]
MSDIPQLPPQARYYSPQGPPAVGDQTLAAPTTAVPLHPLHDTQLSKVLPSDTRLSSLQPAPAPLTVTGAFKFAAPSQSPHDPQRLTTAIVYCEANFGAIDGKTANGLVRHSEKYEILSIIDSEKAGQDAGMVLDGVANDIPVCHDLADALSRAETLPDYFIFGMAPSSGMLSTAERSLVLDAIGLGMNIVNGLHEFLNDDPEFVAASSASMVTMLDVRRPRASKDLRMFSGRIAEVTCPRIAVLGTDCAIGKRTTATILTRALRDRGLNVVMIGTGQTGLIQGARYGIALDAVPSQFCAGELEAIIVEAFEAEQPDVIIIEGQGALSHPAFSTTSFILRGSCPDGVILQHAPGRTYRCDFDRMAMPLPAAEINLIQTFSDTRVIGLTLNHENMTDADVSMAVEAYELELGIPATDALTRSPDRLVEIVLGAFPELGKKLTAYNQ